MYLLNVTTSMDLQFTRVRSPFFFIIGEATIRVDVEAGLRERSQSTKRKISHINNALAKAVSHPTVLSYLFTHIILLLQLNAQL